MSSGQQPVTQQTTQTRDPWIGAQPALNQVQGSASALFNDQQGYTPYAGQTLASLDPNLTTGLGWQNAINTQNIGGTPGVLAAPSSGDEYDPEPGAEPAVADPAAAATGTE